MQNGTVTNCHFGIKVAGDGGHVVTKVIATGNSQGFRIESDDNEVTYNRAIQNDISFVVDEGNRNALKYNLARENNVGFFIRMGDDNLLSKNQAIRNRFEQSFAVFLGSRNKLIENLAKDHGTIPIHHGFQIQGHAHELLSNTAIGGTGDGFHVLPGSGYMVLGNTAKKNGSEGILLNEGAINSQIVGNTSKRNDGTDLVDENPGCDQNQWVGNRFRTSAPPENADCIQ